MEPEDVVEAVRRYVRLIVFSATLAVAISLVAGLILPKVYESEAGVLVGSLTETSADRLAAFQRQSQTYAEVARAADTMERIISSLDLADSASDLARRVEIRALPGQAIVRIVVAATSQVEATRIADAFAAEVAAFGDLGDGGRLATVYQRATSPGDPTSPRILFNALISAILGLAIGLAASLLLVRRSHVAHGTTPERR